MIHPCDKPCGNKTESGYCATTACINPQYSNIGTAQYGQGVQKQIAALRRENDELRAMHQLDMAEIVRLRRWIQALEEEREAPAPQSQPSEKQRVWRKYRKRREEAAHVET